jgi:O-antigen/teichoic acid export membrane protein
MYVGPAFAAYVTAEIGNNGYSAAKLTKLAIWSTSVLALVAVGIAAFSEELSVALLGSSNFREPLALGGVTLLFVAPSAITTGILQASGRFDATTRAQAVRGVTLLTSSIALSAGMSIKGAIAAVIIADALCLLALARSISSQLWFDNSAPDRIRWEQPLALVMTGVITQPAYLLGYSLLARQHGLDAAGTFALADRWRQLALLLPSAIAAPLLVRLTRKSDQLDQGVKASFLFTIVLIAAMGLAASSPTFISMVFGSQYQDAWPLFALIVWTALPIASNTLLGQHLIATERYNHRLGFDALLALLMSGMALLLVPSQGGVGLVLAQGTAFVATSVAIAVATKNRER